LMTVAAVLALVAAACEAGGEDGQEGEGGEFAGERLEVAATWTGAEQERFEAVLQQFEDDTGATVTFTSTGDDIAAVLGPAIEGGEPPDVAILPQPGLLRDYAGQGALQPLDDIAADELEENFAPIWAELGTVDGTLYGLYWKASNKSTVWYNIHSFEDAGVEPPADWDQLTTQTAQAISDFGTPPYSVGAGDGWTLTDIFENIYIRTAGADMYDQLSNHEIPWTDQSVIDALGVFAEMIGDDEFIAGGASGALQTDFNTSVAQVFGNPTTPDAAIVTEPADFVAGIITGETEGEIGTDADFFDFPSIDGSGPAVVAGGDAAVLMTESEAASALIEFLGTPEAGEIWASEGGFISPNQNLDTSVYPDEITQRTAEALVTAAEEGNVRFDMSDLQPGEFGATTGEGMWGLFQEFLRTPDDAQGIAQQLEDAAARAYGE
jgi:alpha-glucoside transport system substrate-binding protein